VEVWTKLPLKTGNGLSVYLGKDQMLYAEDGQQLDPTTHLYDEIDNHDLGEVGRLFVGDGQYFDGVPSGSTRFLARDTKVGARFATGFAVKRDDQWVQIFAADPTWFINGAALYDSNGGAVDAGVTIALWDYDKNRPSSQQGIMTGLLLARNGQMDSGAMFRCGILLKDPKTGHYFSLASNEMGEGSWNGEDGILVGVTRIGTDIAKAAVALKIEGGKITGIRQDSDQPVDSGFSPATNDIVAQLTKQGSLTDESVAKLGASDSDRAGVLFLGNHYYIRGTDGGLTKAASDSIFVGPDQKRYKIGRVNDRDRLIALDTGMVMSTQLTPMPIQGLQISTKDSDNHVYGKMQGGGRLIYTDINGQRIVDAEVTELGANGQIKHVRIENGELISEVILKQRAANGVLDAAIKRARTAKKDVLADTLQAVREGRWNDRTESQVHT
ncbi:hypothetical protein, partial [Burkholderia orbicola]|uniref:hypothetical protein n=1 Tax=Burkholderia orbicola TaxID=2978683 RepID=UPI0026515B49